jgi:hypothetical protein
MTLFGGAGITVGWCGVLMMGSGRLVSGFCRYDDEGVCISAEDHF